MNETGRIALVIVVSLSLPTASNSPFDVLQRACSPYMPLDDLHGFPMKVRSLARDSYTFWRGSKDLFYTWCRTNASDWLADRESYVITHGDLHLGNIGWYMSDAGWGKLAFGLVDLDESAELPFQLELLSGMITLELIASQNRIELDGVGREQVLRVILDSYREALRSGKPVTTLLADDRRVRALRDATAGEYAPYLNEWTVGGKFRRSIRNDKGKLREILQPLTGQRDEIAAAIAQALANSDPMRKLFRFESAEQIRASIDDIALRTRIGSSGSQGLKKYLILLDKPIRGVDCDVIVYLKQSIPSAAERAGVIPQKDRAAARRMTEHADQLHGEHDPLASWCTIGDESFWVTIKNPWSIELDADDVKDFDDLLWAARIWGAVAGSSHASAGGRARIERRLTDELTHLLSDRAKQYLQQLRADFEAFRSDPRARDCIRRVEADLINS